MVDNIRHEWLLESEAAEYCRCSSRSLRRMGIQAYNSGGRKVYRRSDLDAALEARKWDRGVPESLSSADLTQVYYGRTLEERLKGVRLRPYKPRKKEVGSGT